MDAEAVKDLLKKLEHGTQSEKPQADWSVRNSGLEKIYHKYVPIDEVLVPHLVTALKDPSCCTRHTMAGSMR
jgi:hypothetical protein